MRILTWNLNRNRASLVLPQVVERIAPDLVLLQEAKLPTLGWDCSCGSPTRGVDWGSWVLARDGMVEPIEIDNYTGWVGGGRYIGDQGEFYVFSLHSPTSRPEERRGHYVTECRRIVETIVSAVPANAPLIIGGDFNCTVGERLAHESDQNTTSELRALREWREHGFSVAWRDANPDTPLPQTLRWTNAPTTPYHCDGFLIRGFAVSTAEIVDVDLVRRSSDHSPVECCLTPVPSTSINV